MKKLCMFEGCGKDARTKGYCGSHYQQLRQGKELKPLQVQFHGMPEATRFLKRVDMKEKKDCWEWQGSRNRKQWHGQWRNKAGQIELAHRAAWRLFTSDIPEGLCVLHRCDNPVCCNPDHLFLGTQADNLKDMWRKKRARPGVSRGAKHGMSKLNEEAVRQIRSSKDSAPDLAKSYNVSRTTIYDVLKRKIWTHVVQED